MTCATLPYSGSETPNIEQPPSNHNHTIQDLFAPSCAAVRVVAVFGTVLLLYTRLVPGVELRADLSRRMREGIRPLM